MGGNTHNDNPNSIWLYNPNFPLSIVAACLYAIPMLWQLWQTVFKYKSYYFIVVFCGACLEVGGYIARAVSIKFQEEIVRHTLPNVHYMIGANIEKPPYAVSQSFIIIAPLFVGAGDYLLISRLCLRVLPPHHTHIYKIPVAKLTRIFVICDIVTFLIQVSGSGIASSNNWEGDTVKIGEDVLIAGLALQLATFTFFFAIVAQFHMLTRGVEGIREGAGNGWRRILLAVYVSSGLIIVSAPWLTMECKTDKCMQIRCIYRLVEFALGIFGYPFTHEWMFYVLECLPMLPAILVFCVWHPGAYFGAGGRRGGKTINDVPMESSDGSGSRV